MNWHSNTIYHGYSLKISNHRLFFLKQTPKMAINYNLQDSNTKTKTNYRGNDFDHQPHLVENQHQVQIHQRHQPHF